MIEFHSVNNWAVVKTGGKQYKVAEGDLISVEKLDLGGKPIVLNEVLMLRNLKGLVIGKPFVPNAKVRTKVVENFREKKIRVVKFKSKSRYLRSGGHRQAKTSLLVEKIEN